MSDDGSPDPEVRALREAARQLICSMQATSDREKKQVLAAQAFELLRQAAALTELKQKIKSSPLPMPSASPVKAGT
jgi:hypothetical protein